MTVNEMLNKLSRLAAEGFGDFEISFTHWTDDESQLFAFNTESFILDESPDAVDVCYSEKTVTIDIECKKD